MTTCYATATIGTNEERKIIKVANFNNGLEDAVKSINAHYYSLTDEERVGIRTLTVISCDTTEDHFTFGEVLYRNDVQ